MHNESPTTNPVFVTTADLAARWGISVVTVRNTTRAEDFPGSVTLGSRVQRWCLEDIETWEQAQRTKPRTPRVVTGTRPQHLIDTDEEPAMIRRIIVKTKAKAA
jgi:predicted DNA-binding transcriptional regulator AlpA